MRDPTPRSALSKLSLCLFVRTSSPRTSASTSVLFLSSASKRRYLILLSRQRLERAPIFKGCGSALKEGFLPLKQRRMQHSETDTCSKRCSRKMVISVAE